MTLSYFEMRGDVRLVWILSAAILALVAAAHVIAVGERSTDEQIVSGDSDEKAVLRVIARIAATESDDERADLMADFVYFAPEVDRAVLERPAVLDALAALLNDKTQAVMVSTAYLLADIGPAASRALPQLRARLKAYPSSVSVPELGFEFNHDSKPDGAIEHAIARIGGSSP